MGLTRWRGSRAKLAAMNASTLVTDTDASSTYSNYALGHTSHERNRLLRQATILHGWTAEFFRSAGITPGMRVLDVGSGMGDVSLLAAEFGAVHVTGVDYDATLVERARARVAEQGLNHRVDFVQSNIFTYTTEQRFDAVVGRYILPHVTDPVALLRHISGYVRPGGLIVLHEVDFGTPIDTWPHAPLWTSSYGLLAECFRQVGKCPDVGKRLTRIFLDAGLASPSLQGVVSVGGGSGSYLYDWLAETVRSLLPVIEKHSIASASDIQIDTLAERLEAEAITLGCQLIGPTQYGAWITTA